MKYLLFKLIDWFVKFYWNYTYSTYKAKYDLPKDFRFNGFYTKFYGDGKISIGSNSYIGNSSQIQASKGFSVVIGANCRIASGVKIYTGTNEADQDFSISPLVKRFKNVVIGNNVWIGANVFIVPGVTIGENSVIGANSVVTNDIPGWSICGGVPAKIIKEKRNR